MHVYKMTVAAVLCAGSAFAGSYPGVFAPAAGEHLKYDFPAGDCADSAETAISLVRTGDNSVTLKGANTTWLMPGDSGHSTTPFLVKVDGAALTFKSTANTEAPLKFQNFNFRTGVKAGAQSTDAAFWTVFDGGTYNFFDPEGSYHSALPSLTLTAEKTLGAYDVIFSNATTRLPPTTLGSTKVPLSRIRIVGGSHKFYGALAESTTDLAVQIGGNTSCEYEFIASDKATVTMAGEFRFALNKRAMLRVENGSTMDLGTGSQRYFGNSDSTPWIFSVDHATIKSSGEWSFNGFVNRSNRGVIAMTNAVVLSTGSGKMKYSGDLDAEFVNCAYTNNDFVIGTYATTPGTKTRVVFSGEKATSRITGDFFLGNIQAAAVSELEFAGGYHTIETVASRFFIGRYADAYDQNTFIVSGGTVERSKDFVLGNGAGTVADLQLTGGTLYVNALTGSSGATTTLAANGGTVKAYANNPSFFSGITTATIGTNGLTVDTNGKNVTIDQSFTGTGKLILTGGGSVTFAAGCTVAGGIEVRGGTKVVFNGEAVKDLTVGKDGTECVLSVAYETPLVVDGDLDVNAFKVEISGGTYEKSTDFYEIICVKGALVGDTAAKWEDAVFQSGVSSDGALDLSIGEDEGDSLLGFKVRDPITVTVAVPAGEDVVTNKTIKTCAGDTLVFDIGADGSFASDYPVKTGAILVKRGEGALVLGNENNNFQSVTNEAGTIVLKHPNALGGLSVPVSGEGIIYDFAEPGETASTFTVAKQYSNEAILVEIANADVTMPLYDILNGGIVKDGPGAAAFLMPDRNVRLSVANATPWKGNKNGDAGFVIRQGEVAFRGLTPTVRELTYSWANFKLGVDDPIESARVVPPKLVFDHVSFAAAATPLAFGRFVDGPSAGDASVIVTNYAAVSVNCITSGVDKRDSRSKESAYVKIDDHSSITGLYGSYIYGGGCEKLVFDVDHGSSLVFNTFDTRGNFEMNFRNGSSLKKYNSKGALAITYGIATHLTKFRFESGSTCYVNKIGEQQADKTSLKSDCRMLFDDGEWNPLKDTFTFCFERITGELAVKGAGLVLAPTNTQVWTVGTPIVDSAEGAGGLVKRGEGTVILNAANLKYTGVTRLEGGVLDLDGTEVAGLTVETVGGAFANGTLVKPTYRVTVDDDWQAATPAVIDPALVSGRVTIDLGRTEANPLPLPYRSLAVATYTGDVAPDVSKWKATGTGIPNTKVTLAVDPSTKTITATADQRDGFFIFLQ